MLSTLLLLVLAAQPELRIERVAVWPTVLSGPHGQLRELELQNELAVAIAERPTLAPLPPIDGETRERVLTCGSSTGCLAALAEERGAELGLRVAVDLRFDPPLFSLQLVRAGGALAGEAVGERRPGAPLRADVAETARALLDRAGHPARAHLTIAVDPPDARVTLSPEPIATLSEGRFALEPGSYEIHAALEGYVASSQAIEATAGRASSVVLALAPEETASFPWFWAGVTLVAAIGAGTAIALIAGGSDGCLCLSSGAPCEGCGP